VADLVRIDLHPSGASIDVERGTALRDVLYSFGVEFPCGGRGRCARCRVQIVVGALAPSPDEIEILSERERRDGWRLSCRARVEGPLTLEVEQNAIPILGDRTPFVFEPRAGFGVAVDLGTTTLVAQLVDLASGRILASTATLNPQVVHGSDVMSRAEHARGDRGRRELSSLVRIELGKLIDEALSMATVEASSVTRVVLVGNTVMHHLFCGLDVSELVHAPFESKTPGLREFGVAELGWDNGLTVPIHFLPCFGGFVGSDLLAGVLATRMHERNELTALIDLGTNGEVVIGTAGHLLCASTAAGPAFEAGGIEQGMRATRGAIDQVNVGSSELVCHVVGGGEARGICGSGLVDAVASGIELGMIEPSGRLSGGRKRLDLSGPVHLTQADIRQLQLAKAAVAAGIRILLARLGKNASDLQHLFLAGAFGNYVSRSSAERIGLIPRCGGISDAIGNSALLGAKLVLFSDERADWSFSRLRQQVEHVPLAAESDFHDVFIRETRFPEP